MSKYPPVREKDMTSKLWTQWFQSIGSSMPESGDIVTTTGIQTLTNKTIVSPIVSNLNPLRLTYSDASKILKSISNLASWIASVKGLTITDDGDGTITIDVKQQTHEADASTSHAITDPADAPASADALRDDLVANTIPSIEAALNALGTKTNNILSKLESAEILAGS